MKIFILFFSNHARSIEDSIFDFIKSVIDSIELGLARITIINFHYIVYSFRRCMNQQCKQVIIQIEEFYQFKMKEFSLTNSL